MGRLFALADLHLSQIGAKPMDVFGELWADHAGVMAEAWDRTVDGADTVLLAGDLSWARNLEEFAPDLDWIAQRPGRKLLLKGNHDSWWSSAAKVRRILPPDSEILQGDAHLVEGRVVVGARGWTAPDDPTAEPRDHAVFRRELDRLKRSIVDADDRFGREVPRIAMLHYPPWIEGRKPTEVVDLLERGGVSLAVYGHLHGDDHRLAVRGVHRGIDFRFVAADAVSFTPVELPAADRP